MEEWLDRHIFAHLCTQSSDPDIGLPRNWLEFLDMPPVLMVKIQEIIDHVRRLRETQIIYPKDTDVFRWAFMVDPGDIKVIILGQDPYHGHNQATGLAFEVQNGVTVPPSLKNILSEVTRSTGSPQGSNIDCSLSKWAEQGVLLLNAVLTVEKGRPASHNKLGWHILTNHIISRISENLQGCVFMLWGAKAGEKARLIDQRRHLILKSQHPSPLASISTGGSLVPFPGCDHFKKANEYLLSRGQSPIDWIGENGNVSN